MKKKIIAIKNEHLLIEIKKELLSEIRRYKFISFITLTYPKEETIVLIIKESKIQKRSYIIFKKKIKIYSTKFEN